MSDAAVGVVTRAKRFLRTLGPGLITGASDDDPSGISTYSIAGASTGLSMLWLALFTTPMMAVIQGMCARIGMVTGMGFAAAIRKRYPMWVAYAIAAIVIIANTFNVGADIAGMAASAHMLIPLPLLFWVSAFGIMLIFGQIYCSYRTIFAVLKYLTLALFAYIFTAFIVHPDWLLVLRHAIVPEFHLDGHWIVTVVAVLGTTITPYLFFWQASLEVEEEKEQGKETLSERRGAKPVAIRKLHLDVNSGMIISNVVMFFIIVTTATTLGAHAKGNIESAQQAAEALRPLAGNFAYLLFTLGMVGTGLLAVPALAGSSAYIAAETFAFKQGLNQPPRNAKRFYAVIVAGVVIGVLMNVLRIDPIKALFWSAVLNCLAAVPLIGLLTVIANDETIMGRWRSSRAANIWAWATFIVMLLAAISMFVFWKQS